MPMTPAIATFVWPRKSEVVSPMPVVSSLMAQKISPISGTFAFRTRVVGAAAERTAGSFPKLRSIEVGPRHQARLNRTLEIGGAPPETRAPLTRRSGSRRPRGARHGLVVARRMAPGGDPGEAEAQPRGEVAGARRVIGPAAREAQPQAEAHEPLRRPEPAPGRALFQRG